jgi:hypothetical protein
MKFGSVFTTVLVPVCSSENEEIGFSRFSRPGKFKMLCVGATKPGGHEIASILLAVFVAEFYFRISSTAEEFTSFRAIFFDEF